MSERVLVIEEDNESFEMVKMSLLPYDLTVVIAESGEEGVAAAEEKPPGIILLSDTITDMDTGVILRAFKQNPRLMKVPVIVLSSSSDKAYIVALAKLGISGFLVKPFEDTHLVDKIKAHVSVQRSRRKVCYRIAPKKQGIKKILLFGLESTFTRLIAESVGAQYDTYVYHNAAKAVAAFEKVSFDAMVADLSFPYMNHMLENLLKTSDQGARCVVIYDQGNREKTQSVYSLGVKRALAIPFQSNELLAAIDVSIATFESFLEADSAWKVIRFPDRYPGQASKYHADVIQLIENGVTQLAKSGCQKLLVDITALTVFKPEIFVAIHRLSRKASESGVKNCILGRVVHRKMFGMYTRIKDIKIVDDVQSAMAFFT